MTALAVGLLAVAVATVVVLAPLHPAQIWAVVWAIAVGAYSLRLLPYVNLGTLAQALIGGASLGFIGGALAGERLGEKALVPSFARRLGTGEASTRLAAKIALGATALGLCAFLAQAARDFGLRAAFVSSPLVRQAVQTGGFSVTIKYVYAALAAAALCGACAATGAHRRLWAAAAAGAVLSTYFTTGRATVVVATAAALCAHALARPRLPSKRSLVLGAGAVALVAAAIFTIGGSLIGKTFADSELASIDSVFVRHSQLRSAALPYEYLSAPVAAFAVETSIAGQLPRADGCAEFGYLCSVLRHLGLDARPLPSVRPFTARPLKWNTYTSLDGPLLDGGAWLVVPAAVLAGILLGAIWSAARRRMMLAVLCYAALTPAIVTAAGSNNFTAPLLLGAILITVCALQAAHAINGRAG